VSGQVLMHIAGSPFPLADPPQIVLSHLVTFNPALGLAFASVDGPPRASW
jgi:hypothetical protein